MVKKIALFIFCSLLFFGIFSSVQASVAQVSNLHVNSKSSSEVSLHWKKVGGADYYYVRVLQKDNAGNYIFLKKEKSKDNKEKIKDLNADTIYYFKVRAYNNNKHGKYSDKLKVQTEQQATNNTVAAAAVTGYLSTTNSVGRTGAYYLPAGYNLAAKPLLVLYHGTNGNGMYMVNEFIDEAEAHGFIIVAPDSRISPNGDYTWEVGTMSGEITEDYTHVLNCIAEVDNMAAVTFSETKVMAAGHSGGGSSTAYISTNEARFTHFAILHGNVFISGFGDYKPKGWVSTGDNDTEFTDSYVQSSIVDPLQDAGFSVTYNIYSGEHILIEDEKAELIDWWLN